MPIYALKSFEAIGIRTKLPTPLSRLPATQRLPAAGRFRAGITTLLHSRQLSGFQSAHLFFGNAETCLHLRHQGLFKTHKRCTTGSQKTLDFSSNGGIQGRIRLRNYLLQRIRGFHLQGFYSHLILAGDQPVSKATDHSRLGLSLNLWYLVLGTSLLIL